MKKQVLFLFAAILSISGYSQTKFEKGYYIDNSNQKVDCLIKNLDWKNNPTEFEYKLSEDSDNKTGTIKDVKEFGINNIFKYARHTVLIDKSSNTISEMSTVSNPVFNEEELFLKVLIEGKASLYSYEKGLLKRYFYNKDESEIEQLIFKKYLISANQIGENSRYKQQLWNDLKCETFKISRVEKLNYQKNELVRFFIDYNACNNQDFTNFNENQNKGMFNLNIRPGLKSSSLSLQNSFSGSKNIDFDKKLGFRLGIEAEFILPFNNNKWAVVIEPTYQYYKTEKQFALYTGSVDYKSLEFPIGLRHYFFINDNSKIFINALYVFDFSLNSTIEFTTPLSLELNKGNNLAFGLGYKYNDKYSLEFRYESKRDLLNDYVNWTSNYNSISFILGYTLF
ncbi:MAG: tRNA modification GTPase [Xanthomarina sp.]